MERSWTDEQEIVIKARNCNLLVSAAAGSGKTAVLVERIIRRILDPVSPVSIDRMLVVTFTNAAASEMRERIREALEEQLEMDPENMYLQEQSTLVHQAMIMTIHGFCGEVLRTHFHEIDLDPSFSIADEAQTVFMKEEALAELFEEEHEKGDESFLLFAETYAAGKDDKRLENIILQFYEYSMAYPDPCAWRADTLEPYAVSAVEDMNKSLWMRELLKDTKRVIREQISRLEQARELACMEGGPLNYEPELTEHLQCLENALRCDGYEQMRAALEPAASWGRIPSPGKNVDVDLKKRAQSLRDSVKKETMALKEKQFAGEAGDVFRLLQACAPVIRELIRLTDLFQEKYEVLKKESNIVDFSDLEHMALCVLGREENGVSVPTEAALSYAQRFDEVMTDEYQDSNMVQETILNHVSGKKNRFMVGDVKQSIYRFRLARPEIFMEKYDTYERDGESENRLVELHKNFRSRSQVLESVNMLFRQLMARNLGGVDYTEDAALYPGASYEEPQNENDCIPELLLIEEAYEKGEEEFGDVIRQEAICVGRRILNMVGRQPVYDLKKGSYRPAEFKDFVILLRTISGWGDTFAKVLGEMGIPALSSSGRGFFETLEIRTVLSYLAVLDNPRQDIPLAGSLRSPIGNLTDDELAQIRSESKDTDFYDACMSAMEKTTEIAKKLRLFFDTVHDLREESAFTPVHELLDRVLERTGYGDIAAAMPGGSLRRENINLLLQRAVEFERSGSKGLFRFLRFIGRLKNSDTDMGEAGGSGSGDSVVRIMSIHKSKGLEYPIVFVSGLGKGINFTDCRGSLVMHPSLGLGCIYMDPDTRVKIPVPVHAYLGTKLREETLGEELRVLYVAMTRAKEKLILTGWNDTSKTRLEMYAAEAASRDRVLSFGLRESTSNYLDFILAALLHHRTGEELAGQYDIEVNPMHPSWNDGCGFRVRTVSCNGDCSLFETVEQSDRISPEELHSLVRSSREVIYDQDIAERMDQIRKQSEQMDTEDQNIPGKVTVSYLKHLAMEKQQEDTFWFDAMPDDTAETTEEAECRDNRQRGAARGTLYHKVLEEIDFSSEEFGHSEFLEMQLERLVKCGKIHEDEIRSLCYSDFHSFFASDLAKRMHSAAAAGKLNRETPFILGKPARELREIWDSDETVLLQGVVDVWFEESAGIVLVDYKTDRVRENENELAEKYGMQLKLYAEALERLTGRPVVEKIIYSFDRGSSIRL